MSELQQVLDRLMTLEVKVDALRDEVAEWRGARKAAFVLASVIGAAVGSLLSAWRRS